MNRPPQIFLTDLPDRLERQAENVESDGFITAARLMREAAHELRIRREDASKARYSSQ